LKHKEKYSGEDSRCEDFRKPEGGGTETVKNHRHKGNLKSCEAYLTAMDLNNSMKIGSK
jgi:hypothetical protein